jgi:glycosyltransferase involved in cell wall biosynthesis
LYELALCCFYEAYPPASGAASVSYNLAKFWPGKSLLLQIGFRDQKLLTNDAVQVVTLSGATESRRQRLIRLLKLIYRMTAELTGADPSVIVLEGASWAVYHWFLLRRLRSVCPHTKIIYHSHNVEFVLRAQRHSKALVRLTWWAESQLLKHADMVTAVSKVDQDQFARLYGVKSVLLPNGVDLARFGGVDAKSVARMKAAHRLDDRTLIFAGFYSYGPNREAIDFLMRSVMPALRKRYESTSLALTGGGAVPSREPWLKNVGSIAYDDFAAFVAACGVAVAPIFSGSGTRLKILEALAAGIPVVATQKAAEGLPLIHGKDILLAQNVDEFIRCVGDLFDNPDLAASLRAQGTESVAKFSWKAIVSEFEESVNPSSNRHLTRPPVSPLAPSLTSIMKPRILIYSVLIIMAAISEAHAMELRGNRVAVADQFIGATWADKIDAAVAALPATGGIVDAQGFCLGRSMAAADTDVVLGSDSKTIRLNLGPCTYPLGAHKFRYFPNTEVGGMGTNAPRNAGTNITYTGSGAGFSYEGALRDTGVYGVFLHDFSIAGDGTAGSTGIDMTYTLVSTLERISTSGSDNGWKFGGTPTCSCYNQIIRVTAFDHSRGGWLDKTANQNQIFGGAVRADKAKGVGLDIDGGASNQIYSLDIESSAKYSIVLRKNGGNANGNAIVNPYIEAAGPILIDSGATYNSIVGTGGLFERGSVVDNSGNKTNYIHQTGGGGDTDGIWPYFETVQDCVYFGVSPSNSSKLLSDGPDPGDALQLQWNGGVIAPQYGLFGHAPLEIGEAVLHSGADISGLTSTAIIANPSAPSVSSEGSSGSASYSYYLVCHDRNGGVTLPSHAGSLHNGNSTLGATNYNRVSWRPEDGCWSWDILKGNTNTALATLRHPPLSGLKDFIATFKDIGQATHFYISPTRNTTGDLRVSGMDISQGISWPLPGGIVNGASFYCPNCDPPINPATYCTSRASRTGSWVHGLNNHWICVP